MGDARACEAEAWLDYLSVQLRRFPNSKAYFYVNERMAIDADGAPNAYHPDDQGIDALANAGYPNGGWRSVLVVDPDDASQPYIQESGQFAGYFLSKTTLQDKTRPLTDPARYVDSRLVPYLVFPGAFHAIDGTGTFGDLGLAQNLSTGEQTPFIVADAGPQDAKLGEVSIRTAEGLGGRNVNPRNGAGMPRGRFLYVIFPRSKAEPAWPVSPEQLATQTGELLDALGGWDRVLACVT
jgi:hypothetical protein